MSSFDSIFDLEKPADGDTSWGPEARQWVDTLALAHAADRVYKVSPDWTSAALGNSGASDRRHFDTIQGAIGAGEAASWPDFGYLIEVYPGEYNEALTITKNVGIVGVSAAGYSSGGGQNPRIRGDGTASPIVTISPPDSVSILVSFKHLLFENGYATDNATQITVPYLLEVNNQSTTASGQSFITLADVIARCQTIGRHNNWLYGIRCRGYHDLVIKRSQIGGLDFAGGDNDGGIQKLIDVEGFDSSKFGRLLAYDSDFTTKFAATGTPRIFRMDNYARIHLRARCSSSIAASSCIEDGGTGTNVSTGITGTEPADRGNLFGTDLIDW